MIQNRNTVNKIILRYCSFLKKINYIPINGIFFHKNLDNEISENLLAYLKQIYSILVNELNTYSDNKQFTKLLKDVSFFLKSHILFNGMIMSIEHYVAILVMETIQIFTYHKGYISYSEEKCVLEKLICIGRYGNDEQINLCKNLLISKKNLLREIAFSKALETLPI